MTIDKGSTRSRVEELAPRPVLDRSLVASSGVVRCLTTRIKVGGGRIRARRPWFRPRE
jgi:hypothetical protein